MDTAGDDTSSFSEPQDLVSGVSNQHSDSSVAQSLLLDNENWLPSHPASPNVTNHQNYQVNISPFSRVGSRCQYLLTLTILSYSLACILPN